RSQSEEDTITRDRDKELLKQRLGQLCTASAGIEDHLRKCLLEFNGSERQQANTEALHQLLERQAYRLAYWRVASDEINYRRFFDINDLACLRMEEPKVFQQTHGLILELISEGKIQGLRIDHPDGLHNPAEYFQHLQKQIAEINGKSSTAGDLQKSNYLVAEKIL